MSEISMHDDTIFNFLPVRKEVII